MPYPEMMVAPMRKELTSEGFRELRSPDEVDEILGRSEGSVLVAVNSVCGCAAGLMRPAVTRAMEHSDRPDVAATVFAGADVEATERARSYFTGHPPSSPSVALLRDGELVFMLERRDIEGRTPEAIHRDLVGAFEEHLAPSDAPARSAAGSDGAGSDGRAS